MSSSDDDSGSKLAMIRKTLNPIKNPVNTKAHLFSRPGQHHNTKQQTSSLKAQQQNITLPTPIKAPVPTPSPSTLRTSADSKSQLKKLQKSQNATPTTSTPSKTLTMRDNNVEKVTKLEDPENPPLSVSVDERSPTIAAHDQLKISVQIDDNILNRRVIFIPATQKQTTVSTATTHPFTLVDLSYINYNVTNDLCGSSSTSKSKQLGFKVDETGLAQQSLKLNQWLYSKSYSYPNRVLHDELTYSFRILSPSEIKDQVDAYHSKVLSNKEVNLTEMKICFVEPIFLQRWAQSYLTKLKTRAALKSTFLIGLNNMGNTCYLNSALQMVLCNPLLSNFLAATAPNYIILEVVVSSLSNWLALYQNDRYQALPGANEAVRVINTLLKYIREEHAAMMSLLTNITESKPQMLKMYDALERKFNNTSIDTKNQKNIQKLENKQIASQYDNISLTLQEQSTLFTTKPHLDPSNPLHFCPIEEINPLYQLSLHDPHRLFCPKMSKLPSISAKTGKKIAPFCVLCSLSRLVLIQHGHHTRVDVKLIQYIIAKHQLDEQVTNTALNLFLSHLSLGPVSVIDTTDGIQPQQVGKVKSIKKEIQLSIKSHIKPSLLLPPRKSINPAPFSSKISQIMSNVSFFGSQEDSHECLQAILDYADTIWLQSALFPYINAQNKEEFDKLYYNIDSHKGIGKMLRDNKINHTSPLRHITGGSTMQSIKCTQCNNVSNTVQAFTSLTLDIPEQKSNQTGLKQQLGQSGVLPTFQLKDCFNSTFKQSVLQGDNAYHCEKCKAKVKAIKTTSLLETPNVMYVHLNRFTVAGLTQYGTPRFRKINSHIEVPEVFDCAAYVQPETKKALDSLIKSKQLQLNKTASNNMDDLMQDKLTNGVNNIYTYNNTRYVLFGTAVHLGNINGGHYFSYGRYGDVPKTLNTANLTKQDQTAQHQANTHASEVWYEIDDDIVAPTTYNTVKKQSAYVLVFVKEQLKIPTVELTSGAVHNAFEKTHDTQHQSNIFTYITTNQKNESISASAIIDLQLGGFAANTSKLKSKDLSKNNMSNDDIAAINQQRNANVQEMSIIAPVTLKPALKSKFAAEESTDDEENDAETVARSKQMEALKAKQAAKICAKKEKNNHLYGYIDEDDMSTDSDDIIDDEDDEYDSDFIDDDEEEEFYDEDDDNFMQSLRKMKQGIKADKIKQIKEQERIKNLTAADLMKKSNWQDTSSDDEDDEMTDDDEDDEMTDDDEIRPSTIVKPKDRLSVEKDIYKNELQHEMIQELQAKGIQGIKTFDDVVAYKTKQKQLTYLAESEDSDNVDGIEDGDSTDDEDINYEDDIPSDEKEDIQFSDEDDEDAEFDEDDNEDDDFIGTSDDDEDLQEHDFIGTSDDEEDIQEDEFVQLAKPSKLQQQLLEQSFTKTVRVRRVIESETDEDLSQQEDSVDEEEENLSHSQFNEKQEETTPVKGRDEQMLALPTALKKDKKSAKKQDDDAILFGNIHKAQLDSKKNVNLNEMTAEERLQHNKKKAREIAKMFSTSTLITDTPAYVDPKDMNDADSSSTDSADDAANEIYTTLKKQARDERKYNKKDLAHRKDEYERELDKGRIKKVRAEYAGKDKVWQIKKQQEGVDSFKQSNAAKKRKQPQPLQDGDDDLNNLELAPEKIANIELLKKTHKQYKSADQAIREAARNIDTYTASAFEQHALVKATMEQNVNTRNISADKLKDAMRKQNYFSRKDAFKAGHIVGLDAEDAVNNRTKIKREKEKRQMILGKDGKKTRDIGNGYNGDKMHRKDWNKNYRKGGFRGKAGAKMPKKK